MFSRDTLVVEDPTSEFNATQAGSLLEQAADLYAGRRLPEKAFIEEVLERLKPLCPDRLECWDALPLSVWEHCALRPDVVLRLCRSATLSPLGSHPFSRATILRILTHPRYGRAFSNFRRFHDWTEIPEEERWAFADYWLRLSGTLENTFLQRIVAPLETLCTSKCQNPTCQLARKRMFERTDRETPLFWLTTLFPEGGPNRLAIATRVSEMCGYCRNWVRAIWRYGRSMIWNMLPPNRDSGYLIYARSLTACRDIKQHDIGHKPDAVCDVERDSTRSLVPRIAYGTFEGRASVESPEANPARAALQCAADMYTHTNTGSAQDGRTAWNALLLIEPLHPLSLSSWDCLPCPTLDRQHLTTVFRLIHEVNNDFPNQNSFLCAALLRILQAYGRDAAAAIERDSTIRKVRIAGKLPNGTSSPATLEDLYCVLCTETYAEIQLVLERFATSWIRCAPTCARQAECTRFAMQTHTKLGLEDAVRDTLRMLYPEGPQARMDAIRMLWAGFCAPCIQHRISRYVQLRHALWNSLGSTSNPREALEIRKEEYKKALRLLEPRFWLTRHLRWVLQMIGVVPRPAKWSALTCGPDRREWSSRHVDNTDDDDSDEGDETSDEKTAVVDSNER